MDNENYTKTMLDYITSDDPSDRFIVLSSVKAAKTDSSGIAYFNTLSLMDVDHH